MLISSIAYGVIPAIIGDGKEGLVGKAVFTWRLLLFCIAKSVAGMCFACLSTMGAPLTFDDFGPANFMLFIPLIYIVAGVGGVAGPITAINIAYYKYYDGKTFAQAFHIFFYLGAGLAFASFLLCAYSWWLIVRAERRIAASSS